MALGNSSNKNVIFVALKQKASAQDNPRFAIAGKDDKGKWVETSSYNFIEGQINSAKVVEKEFKPGKKENVFELEMEDNGEIYKVTMPHGSLTYNFINSLATNVNSLSKYKFTVTKKLSKDGKYWNAQGYINVDGSTDMQKWSIDPQSTPKAEPVMVNGTHFEVNSEKQYDKTKVKAFWEQLFTENITSKLTGGNKSSGSTTSNNTSATNNNSADINTGSVDDSSDMPW